MITARRRKRLRKRLDANSIAAKRLSSAVFYLDESIYSRRLADAMREAGAEVVTPYEGGLAGTTDESWLAHLAEKPGKSKCIDEGARFTDSDIGHLLDQLQHYGGHFVGGRLTCGTHKCAHLGRHQCTSLKSAALYVLVELTHRDAKVVSRSLSAYWKRFLPP